MLEGLSKLAGLVRSAQQVQERAQEMKERLAALHVEGASGGGMVRVRASGDQRILSLHIEPSLLESGDQELLEDLILSAVNLALEESRELAAREMANLAEGLGFPGLEDAFSRLGLGK